jgi:hypothetical protein
MAVPDIIGRAWNARMSAIEEMLKMLMHDYAAKSYIKVEDVKDGPICGTIKDVRIGDFGRPVIELENGRRFSVNKKNTSILIEAFGEDSRDWSGCQIELVFGHTKYQGDQQDSVIVRPLNGAE